MLQFVSNQDFPDLFEDQMTSAGSTQNGGANAVSRPAVQAPQTPQTPKPPQTLTPAVYQSSNVQTLSPQSLPLTPPLTPAQTPSPTIASSGQQQQVTRSPPLLQPRPQLVQPIQPQQTAQPTIQVQYPLTSLSHTNPVFEITKFYYSITCSTRYVSALLCSILKAVCCVYNVDSFSVIAPAKQKKTLTIEKSRDSLWNIISSSAPLRTALHLSAKL